MSTASGVAHEGAQSFRKHSSKKSFIKGFFGQKKVDVGVASSCQSAVHQSGMSKVRQVRGKRFSLLLRHLRRAERETGLEYIQNYRPGIKLQLRDRQCEIKLLSTLFILHVIHVLH